MSKNKGSKTKGKHKTWRGIVILLGLVIMPMWICGVFDSPKDQAPLANLSADVSYNLEEGVFLISNRNPFHWTNVGFELNSSGLLGNGFKMKTPVIEGLTSYTVGALQFTKPNGTIFNPLLMRPQTMTITCDTSRGRGVKVLRLSW